jgi:DNA mismatch repair ATPase MutS
MIITEELFQFTRFGEFYENFRPLTVFGKRVKNRLEVFDRADVLQEIFTRIAKAVDFIAENPERANQVEFFLKRISPLNSFEKETFDTTDFFLIKRFLSNFKSISSLLSPELKAILGAGFELNDLLSLLSKGEDEMDIFYISGNYDPRLKAVRLKIEAIDQEIQAIRSETFLSLREKYGLNFMNFDFLVVPESVALRFEPSLIYKEPYDNASVLVKPVMPELFFAKTEERENLIITETELEQEVLLSLSAEVKKQIAEIERAINDVENIDVYLAKARMVQVIELTSPILTEEALNIEVMDGHFLPLEKHCSEKGLRYQPLDVIFDNQTIVIKGSNMGGKTVFLQTIGFLQLISQMGFWVPAKRFRSRIFKHIHSIGIEHNSGEIQGLSSFGKEVYQLSTVLNTFDEPVLVLIDEFGRTTNSMEGEALTVALLETFSGKSTVNAFLSTHFTHLPLTGKASVYRMKGLNYEAFEEEYSRTENLDLSSRIKLLNLHNDYSVVKDTADLPRYDALKIAESIGLNKELIKRAIDILERRNE